MNDDIEEEQDPDGQWKAGFVAGFVVGFAVGIVLAAAWAYFMK